MVGGIYRSGEYPENPKKLPVYYDDKLFIFDWVRRWVKAVSQDPQGNITKIEPFMADNSFSAPIDLRFAPDGSLYVVEYGSAWFSQNDDAYLSRLEYYDGDNPPPVAVAVTDRKAGALPFKAKLSAAESFDRNGPANQLSYSWDLLENGKVSRHIATSREAEFSTNEPGEFRLKLTVTDIGGASSSTGVVVVAGNEPPAIAVDFTGGNSSFYWQDTSLSYSVGVTDLEDGTTIDGSIPSNRVTISFDYLAEGMDTAGIVMGHLKTASDARDGMALMKNSDCLACHTADKKSVGPSFSAIAERYDLRDDLSSLTDKILNGGGGTWGDHAMPPHPQLNRDEAGRMVSYILDPNAAASNDTGLPAQGSLEFQQHLGNFIDMGMAGKVNRGQYLLNVSYKDKGYDNIPPLTTRQSYRLRYPLMLATEFDDIQNGLVMQVEQLGGQILIMRSGDSAEKRSFARLNQADLTDIKTLRVGVITSKMFTTGGELSLRLDDMRNAPVAGTVIKNKNLGIPTDLTYYDLAVADIDGTHDIFLISETLAEPGTQSPNFVLVTVEFVRGEAHR
jgi:cytochrome c